MLLDAVAGGFAQLARRHAGEVGQVRIEAPLQQLLHQVTATGLHGDMQRRVALLVAELRRVRVAHVHEEGTDALAVVALHGVENASLNNFVIFSDLISGLSGKQKWTGVFCVCE